MKKLLLITTLIVSMVGTSIAQNTVASPEAKAKPEVRAKESVAKMHITCTLVGEQTSKVNKIFIDYFTALDALEAKKAKTDSKEYEKQMTAIETKRNEALGTVLTPEQVKLLQAKNKQKTQGKAAGK